MVCWGASVGHLKGWWDADCESRMRTKREAKETEKKDRWVVGIYHHEAPPPDAAGGKPPPKPPVPEKPPEVLVRPPNPPERTSLGAPREREPPRPRDPQELLPVLRSAETSTSHVGTSWLASFSRSTRSLLIVSKSREDNARRRSGNNRVAKVT